MHEGTASNLWWEMEIVQLYTIKPEADVFLEGHVDSKVARYLEAREIVVWKSQTHLFEEVHWSVEVE